MILISSIFVQGLFNRSRSFLLRLFPSINNFLTFILDSLIINRFSLSVRVSRRSVIVNLILIWWGIWPLVLFLLSIQFFIALISCRGVVVLVTWLSHLLLILFVLTWLLLSALSSLSRSVLLLLARAARVFNDRISLRRRKSLSWIQIPQFIRCQPSWILGQSRSGSWSLLIWTLSNIFFINLILVIH